MRRWGYCATPVLPILEAFRFAKPYMWRRRYYLSGVLTGARVRCCVREPSLRFAFIFPPLGLRKLRILMTPTSPDRCRSLMFEVTDQSFTLSKG